MGRMRGIGIAGVIALIATPSIALAGSPQKPLAGTWTSGPNGVPTSFVVAGNRTEVTSLTFGVISEEINPGCPTGTVSVPGPIGLKLYKFSGTHPFWAFGKVGHRKTGHNHSQIVFEEAPVRATLDGQPIKGAALRFEFGKERKEGILVGISGGVFEFSANCQASLNEADSPSPLDSAGG